MDVPHLTIAGVGFGVYSVTSNFQMVWSAVEATLWVSDSSTILKAVSLSSSSVEIFVNSSETTYPASRVLPMAPTLCLLS
jgi:hypothetical protein